MSTTTGKVRLELTPRSAQVTIRADRSLGERYRTRFEGPAPHVREQDGTIAVEYPRFARISDGLTLRRPRTEILLNPSLAWEIEIRGGVSGLRADLRDLNLRSLDISGGATNLTAELPQPHGAVPVRIAGGVSDAAIGRPQGVPLRLRVDGGASELGLDEQRFGALGGEIRLETEEADTGADRVDLEVGGGASKLTVTAGVGGRLAS